MYNVLHQLRAGKPLSKKEQRINEEGLVSTLLELHDKLDATVAETKGWPADLPDAEILERLVALNHKRAQEEAQGFIRYLRPPISPPEGSQQTALSVDVTTERDSPGAREKHSWPRTLSERLQP